MTEDSNAQLDYWDRRYKEEGHIWGDDPSRTAKIVLDGLKPNSKVLDIGFGYGRDLLALVGEGHIVRGVEKSSEGLNEAVRQLKEYLDAGHASLSIGDFTKTDCGTDFDAVCSHRMLHLVKPEKIERLVKRISDLLKPGGLVVIGARNPDDFNSGQMTKINETTAVYKDRPDHIINFWNEDRYEDAFSDQFNILNFYHGEEIESQRNPIPSHFTIMVAQKKTHAELVLNQKRENGNGGHKSPSDSDVIKPPSPE